MHRPFIGSGVDLRYTSAKFWRFFKHVFFLEWYSSEKHVEKHIACSKMTHRVSVLGKEVPFSDSEITIDQVDSFNLIMEN